MKRTKAKDNTNRNPLHTIKAKVTILCTIFILIAVTINCTIVVSIASNTIMNNTKSTMLDLVETSNINLVNVLSKVSESVNFIMNSDSLANYISSNGEEESDEITKFVSMMTSMNTTTETISILDSNGVVLASSDSSLVGTDLSSEDYYTKMIETNATTESDVSISKTSGDAYVAFAIPVYENRDMGSSEESLPPMDTTDSTATGNEATTETPTTDTTEAVTTDSAAKTDSAAPTDNEAPARNILGSIVTYVKTSEFTESLSQINISGVKSSYAYLIDSTGNIVYHPTEEKVGTAVTNKTVTDLIANISNNSVNSSGIIEYKEDGTSEIASYQVSDNGWTLIIVADKQDILSSTTAIILLSILISFIIIVILGLIAYLFSSRITKPIKQITHSIHKSSELDFTEDIKLIALEKRKDETGEIAIALGQMKNSLHNMIDQITNASTDITSNANHLNTITNSVTDHASDNSSTAQELAAGMEETAATTEMIHSNIVQVRNNTNSINEEAANGANLSKELINRAISLKDTTKDASKRTTDIYQEIKTTTENAIEQAKAVDKINLLTKTIMDIADQTSLLALNATIEAARAGDSGRGFAVVASEIGSLADQSAHTVSNITAIVNEVNFAVNNMTKSLQQTIEFLEKKVLNDYDKFMNASDQYSNDASTLNNTMESIHEAVNNMNLTMLSITDSISEINTMITEASEGVVDVTEKNTNIVALTNDTYEMVKENNQLAENLQSIVTQFKL